jgi:hypothetical protein
MRDIRPTTGVVMDKTADERGNLMIVAVIEQAMIALTFNIN